ncbi:hypothetical protein IP81_01430 [Novosphingobium sp. AAP83]|uniref:hypothetical protein n=1 Tax=Novosphingobium sp. AAP83 TaxID=1523425 RepID=UPI0006B9AF0F|nr:hypothetical protein [Novosphingobium sp. AAP83]KPF93830.1 hypothetical protein IP81_01430 [Novosphingobium sp. AAP83]
MKRHLGGAIALALCLAAPAWANAGNGVGTQFELTFWQAVNGSDDPALYEAYLQQYPTGTFSALAKAKVAKFSKGAEPAKIAPAASASAPSTPVVSAPVGSTSAPLAALAAPLTKAAVVVTRGNAAPLPVTVAASVAGAASVPVAALNALQASAADTASGAKPVRLAYDTAQMTDDAAPKSEDTALLQELAKSQELGAVSLRVAVAQGFALPVRPVINDVPELPLPAAFCSAEQRNAFHETRYKPLMEIARVNNALASQHMKRLQQEFDSYQLARDPAPMNAVAKEASAWQQVATQAYNRQLGMVQQFHAIMAVPVTACQMAAAQ